MNPCALPLLCLLLTGCDSEPPASVSVRVFVPSANHWEVITSRGERRPMDSLHEGLSSGRYAPDVRFDFDDRISCEEMFEAIFSVYYTGAHGIYHELSFNLLPRDGPDFAAAMEPGEGPKYCEGLGDEMLLPGIEADVEPEYDAWGPVWISAGDAGLPRRMEYKLTLTCAGWMAGHEITEDEAAALIMERRAPAPVAVVVLRLEPAAQLRGLVPVLEACRETNTRVLLALLDAPRRVKRWPTFQKPFAATTGWQPPFRSAPLFKAAGRD
jgi:hypothetical protein